MWWKMEFITTSKGGRKLIRKPILTGNVIKDEVEPVVKLTLFWISKIIV